MLAPVRLRPACFPSHWQGYPPIGAHFAVLAFPITPTLMRSLYSLSPDHLHDAVANLGFSTQFQHTEKPTLATDYQNGLVTVINGRGERI